MKTLFLLMLCSFAPGMVGFACTSDDGGGDSASDSDSDSDSDTDSDSDSDPLNCEGGRYDQSTGLCWQHPKASGTYEWQEAIDYCDGLDLAGHTDWYLPGRDDFIDLLGGCESDVMNGGYGYCNSCDESETCSMLFDSDNDYHWSSSPYGSNMAWYVDFNYGGVSHLNVGNDYDVRCVRSGP